MSLMTKPYSRRLPLARRRALAWTLGASLLALQLFLPSMDSERFSGIWSLLLLPIIFYAAHQLTSDGWVWNRLFRKETDLDEYETHARNAFIARAYSLLKGWCGWLHFAALLIGAGFISRFPALNPFADANKEAAIALYVITLWWAFEYLPRIVAALSEDEVEE